MDGVVVPKLREDTSFSSFLGLKKGRYFVPLGFWAEQDFEEPSEIHSMNGFPRIGYSRRLDDDDDDGISIRRSNEVKNLWIG